MKKEYALAAAMPFILAFMVLGCASSPETQKAEEPPVAEEQPIAEAAAKTEPTKDLIDEDKGASRASDLQRQIQDAQEDAKRAGANELYPEQFGKAESGAQRSRELLAAGDAAASYAEGRNALLWFQILKNLADARNLRETILEYGFDAEESEAFADAEAKYGEALAILDSSPEQANELSLQALEAFQAVRDSGFRRIAEGERARAIEARELCDSITAARSMSSEYQSAAGTFNNAEQSESQGDWEGASKGYRDAASMFAEVYQSALYKKNAADEAMRAARARQETSRALALEADKIAPLPDEDELPPDESLSPSEGAMLDSEPSERIAASARALPCKTSEEHSIQC